MLHILSGRLETAFVIVQVKMFMVACDYFYKLYCYLMSIGNDTEVCLSMT